jgi:hypothetical protein
MPFVDMVEFIVQLVAIILLFTLQETWFAHFSLVLAANLLATTIKLICSPVIFMAGIPLGKKGLINTWQFKCYGWVRFAALTIFIWSSILNFALATWTISDSGLYNDPSWGMCSFCYKVTEC